LTETTAPRLYGVDVKRVIDIDGLRSALANADVLIADSPFDTDTLPIRRCVMLRGVEGVESFAADCGFDCVDEKKIAEWFLEVLGVDVTRKARAATGVSTVSGAKAPKALAGNADRHGVMYEGLVNELRKNSAYTSLDPDDGRTYDILIQTMRGTLRGADAVAQDLQTQSKRLAEAEAELARVVAEREVIDEDVSAVTAGLKQAISECLNILREIANLSSDADLVEYGEVAIKARAAIGLSQKFASVVEAKELRAIGVVATEYMSCVSTVLSDLATLGAGSLKAGANAVAQAREGVLAKANAEREVKRIAALLAQEKRDRENLARLLAESQENLGLQMQKVAEAENKLLLSGTYSVPALQERITLLQNELREKDEALMHMRGGENVDDVGVSILNGVSPEVIQDIVKQLRIQVASLKIDRDRALEKLKAAKNEAARESDRAETLSNSARGLSQVVLHGAQVSAIPVFRYTEKALILPVFGNGSAGISSTAVSLAKMLGHNSRAVIVDFDIVTTDLEGRFGKRINPLVSGIDGVSTTSGKNSAMSLFIERGAEFFISHFQELVVRIDANKGGVLDYLPGIYVKPDLFNLTQANYSALLGYLGARYDYIVIDAGKLGCSEIGDQILRNLCLCAFRQIIVTDASVEKTRAMRVRLIDVFHNELRQVLGRSVWVANRAITREDLSSFTLPSACVTLPVIPAMVGEHQSFHITGSAVAEFKKVVKAVAGVG
jgi:hypothetical protein